MVNRMHLRPHLLWSGLFSLVLGTVVLDKESFASSGCVGPTDEKGDAAPTKICEAVPGLIRAYADKYSGKYYLEVPSPGEEYFYVTFMVSGIGSPDLAWEADPASMSRTRIVSFHRFG